MTIRRVLIANRGEIAVRVIRACQMLGIETVLATSEADRDAMPAQLADRAVCIGSARSTDSYLNYRAIVTAATATGCDAVHPGYGFLSEKPELADACASEGLIFVGPMLIRPCVASNPVAIPSSNQCGIGASRSKTWRLYTCW